MYAFNNVEHMHNFCSSLRTKKYWTMLKTMFDEIQASFNMIPPHAKSRNKVVKQRWTMIHPFGRALSVTVTVTGTITISDSVIISVRDTISVDIGTTITLTVTVTVETGLHVRPKHKHKSKQKRKHKKRKSFLFSCACAYFCVVASPV